MTHRSNNNRKGNNRGFGKPKQDSPRSKKSEQTGYSPDQEQIADILMLKDIAEKPEQVTCAWQIGAFNPFEPIGDKFKRELKNVKPIPAKI